MSISSPTLNKPANTDLLCTDHCKTCMPIMGAAQNQQTMGPHGENCKCGDWRGYGVEWGIGYPGGPYDTWSPERGIAEPHGAIDLRGWCHVKNNTDLSLQLRSEGSGCYYLGNQVLIIDATLPDGTKLHLAADYALSRGGTDFTINLVKKFSEEEQKEIYSLSATWTGGWRHRYDEAKRALEQKQKPQKAATKKLTQLSQRA